ncbi:MAG: RNA-binding S4 domain-containing protein [Chitinophagales bacterium]
MPEKVTKCRIDKWLWAVRLYKSRTIAVDAVKSGKVKINGVSVKPAFEISAGTIVTIQKGVVKYQFKVTDILERRVSAILARTYCEDITPEEEKMKLTHLEYMPQAFREKGTGRPTKKDRRDIDEWMQD